MAFFTTETFSGINKNHLKNVEAKRSVHDPGLKGAMNVMIESEQNYVNLMKAVGVLELGHYAKTGEVIVYEGSTISGFFSKLKEFFVKLFKRVKALFISFIAMLDQWIRKDDSFVKTYRRRLMNIDTRGFKYKGFEFTTGEININNSSSNTLRYIENVGLKKSDAEVNTNKADDQLNAVKKWESKRDEHVGQLRAEALGESKKLDIKQFHNALYKKLRNKKDKKEDIDKINVDGLLEIISSFKNAKTKAKEIFDTIEKEINTIIKDLNTQEKDILKAMNAAGASTSDTDKQLRSARSAAIKYVSTLATANKARLNILQQIQGGIMSALKQQNRQAKAVCVKLLRYQPKKAVNAGYEFNDDESSFLSSVVLK